MLEQSRLTGHRKDPIDRPVVFGEDAFGDRRLSAELQIFDCHETIGLGEAHLRVVDEYAQQRPFPIGDTQLIDVGSRKRAPMPYHAGKVETDLGPREDPGDRAKRFEAGVAGCDVRAGIQGAAEPARARA